MLEWSRTASLGYMSISWGHSTLVSSKSFICAIYESSSIVKKKTKKKPLSNYFPVSFVFVHTVWVFPLGRRHFSKQQQMNNAKGIKGFFLHFSYMSHNTSVVQVKKRIPTRIYGNPEGPLQSSTVTLNWQSLYAVSVVSCADGWASPNSRKWKAEYMR